MIHFHPRKSPNFFSEPMKFQETLSTYRLTLRRPRIADTAQIIQLAGERRIAETTSIPHPYQPYFAHEWVNKDARNRLGGRACAFVLEWAEEGRIVGAIELILDSTGVRGRVGYWIGVPYWRQGFATEALREILRHAFEDLRLPYVGASHLLRNPASGRVMEKAGLRLEKIVSRVVESNGVVENVAHRGLFADEWRSARRGMPLVNDYLL